MGPLSHSYAAAGFFPRSDDQERRASSVSSSFQMAPGDNLDDNINDEQQISTTNNNGEESVYSQTRYWLIEDPPKLDPDGKSLTPRLNRQFVNCTQTRNLRDNFLYWDAKSKERQQSLTMSTATTASSLAVSRSPGSDGDEAKERDTGEEGEAGAK